MRTLTPVDEPGCKNAPVARRSYELPPWAARETGGSPVSVPQSCYRPSSPVPSLPGTRSLAWARPHATELGSELVRKLQQPLLEIIARNCSRPAVARAAGLTL